MKVYGIVVVLLGVLLAGCDRDPGLPSDDQQVGAGFEASGFAESYSQEEFSSLSALEQYEVANKILNTMYKSVGADEFFDLSQGMNNLTVVDPDFVENTRTALATDLSEEEKLEVATLIDGLDENGNATPDLAKYRFDEDRPRELPLARIYEYPVSRDAYVEWMAYFLVNTIMFSPALEMESTGIGDVQNTFRTLVSSISERKSVRQIIRSHLPSVARWRVSRSPENHALEAYELYLGLFETAEDSRKGGIACREWFLTDEDDGYQLVRSDEINTVPQIVLENYFITNCNDLYDVIAGHPLVIPRVIEVIVNYLMSGRSTEDRFAMIEAISASQPETFEDIFSAIIFSREYLLNTERPKTFEENGLAMLHKFKWNASSWVSRGTMGSEIFRNMASRRRTGSSMHMGEMGWNTMSYKIGRAPDVPTDALSFANYHRAIRENIMRHFGVFYNLIYDEVEDDDDNPQTFDRVLKPEFASMSPDDYLDFWFLQALGRPANADERTDLMTYFGPDSRWFFFDDEGTLTMNQDEWAYRTMATLTLDYISRLPEFYYFKAINQG